jgi:hypothetical protein
MPWTSKHTEWLVRTGKKIFTKKGKPVEIIEFRHKSDPEVLSAWAKHFRNHYCRDSEIDFLRKGYSFSRKDYLLKIKFPDEYIAPGPSLRAGDFGEILVADYLNFILGFWVPRTRFSNRDVRNDAEQGCDVIGFKIISNEISIEDTLAIFEAKTQFSGKKAKQRLQDAVNGSAKDHLRKAESLNAIKQRLFDKGHKDDSERIERFQNPDDKPYKELYGAVALFNTNILDETSLKETTHDIHPAPENLSLIVIHGEQMMSLANELYRMAANEA